MSRKVYENMDDRKLIDANTKLVDEMRNIKKDIMILIKYIKGIYVDNDLVENIIDSYTKKQNIHKSWSKHG